MNDGWTRNEKRRMSDGWMDGWIMDEWQMNDGWMMDERGGGDGWFIDER
jgi:hypothetical protein